MAEGEEETDNLSYLELDQRARAIGAWLQSIGSAGQRVLLLYPSGLDYVAAFFGCLYAGAVAVPAYPPRRNRNMLRLQAIVANAGATAALTTTSSMSNVTNHFEHSPDLEKLHWLSTDGVAADLAGQWKEPNLRGDDLAFLQYTSGSTAAPKGVMVSHGNLLHNGSLIQ
ncbi:MAG TPA: AMP-binding protein, partial [Blastocatellia bacterium]|nr:AMP-binding protein [Blastocatellia bacterium]